MWSRRLDHQSSVPGALSYSTTRRQWLLALAMMGTAAASQWATPRRYSAQEDPLPSLGSLLPPRLGTWIGEDASRLQLVSPDVQAVLQRLYQQTLARLYRHPEHGMVMLAAAYGGDQSDATRVHRPEVCYPAQGFTVTHPFTHVMRLGRDGSAVDLPVQRLVARLGSRHEPVSYWINVGGTVVTSGTQQKLAQMAHGLRGVVPDGLLVRVSTLDRQTDRAWSVHATFIAALHRGVSESHRARVFGKPSA